MTKIDVFLLKLEPDYESYHLAPPFGILYVADALEKKGFRVKVYHEKGKPAVIDKIAAEVIESRPLFAGVSTMTGPSLLPSLALSRKIKERSDIPVVWGGMHPTMLPEQTLNEPSIDVAVTGEGEAAAVEIAEGLSGRGLDSEALKSISGIAFRENGRIVVNPVSSFIADLDAYSPAWRHVDRGRYIYKSKTFYSEMGSKLPGESIAAVITSRGCPWRCGYCYNQFVNKRTFRAHSAERVIAEVEALKKDFAVSAVIFEDDDFFANKKRALEVVRKIGIPWSSSIRANYIARWGEDFIKEISENNCVEIRIGAESGSPRVLEIMHKDITVEDILRSAELCKKYKVHHLTNFMIGIPGETWEDMLMTFDLMDRLEMEGHFVNGPSVYLPWPGTPLYETAVEQGFKPPEEMTAWAVQWGKDQPRTPFLKSHLRLVNHYRTLALRDRGRARNIPVVGRTLKALARKRWEKRFFKWPLDYSVPAVVLETAKAFRRKNATQG